MTCFMCQGPMLPHTVKDFNGQWGLGRVHYERCRDCGLVVSRTLLDMPDSEWAILNRNYHTAFFAGLWQQDDPRRLERMERQAAVIGDLADRLIIPRFGYWVDHGCGDGKLADLLRLKKLPVAKYEPYGGKASWLDTDGLWARQWDMVISTCVAEHARGIEDLDSLNLHVADKGVLALHTWVGETVPSDPAWFYYLPVHATFYTNRAMSYLFERWAFAASLYHVDARLWFWFGRDPGPVEGYHYKRGFMDYWK